MTGDAPSNNRYLTKADMTRCHAGAWSDAEIRTYLSLAQRFAGRDDAGDLAERLILRSRDGDDRISCGECRQGKSARCNNVMPITWDVMNRCEMFEGGEFDADRDLPTVRPRFKRATTQPGVRALPEKAALGTPQRVRHNGVPVIHASEF
jgi:hypothetical protein